MRGEEWQMTLDIISAMHSSSSYPMNKRKGKKPFYEPTYATYCQVTFCEQMQIMRTEKENELSTRTSCGYVLESLECP